MCLRKCVYVVRIFSSGGIPWRRAAWDKKGTAIYFAAEGESMVVEIPRISWMTSGEERREFSGTISYKWRVVIELC